jgi:hypothetical protein
MKLVIFHYHLLPGGVTGVIDASVRALITNCTEIEAVTLVCGREDNAAQVLEKIETALPQAARIASIHIMKEIDYFPADNNPQVSVEAMKAGLLAHFAQDDEIWWVHNYQLGKNPVFTRAILDIAADYPQQRILLHIHDFPECSRYQNLKILRTQVTNPYPVFPNLRYAVINMRDYQYLVDAGIPEDAVFLLLNPISFTPAPEGDRDAIKASLIKTFSDKFPSFKTDAPVLFYPVRTIRRKNIFESAMIARLTSWNLLVTLPGVSEQERKFSSVVQSSYINGEIPGMWGIGTEIEKAGIGFRDLIAVSDAVISSSVQEGFGYLFVNSILWKKPLLARYLDILDGITDTFEGHPHDFYFTFLVDNPKPQRKSLLKQYNDKVDTLASFLPEHIIEALAVELNETVGAHAVDFSFLPVDIQRETLKKLDDGGFRHHLVTLNNSMLEQAEDLLCTKASTANLDILQEHFSFAAFADQTMTIINSFGQETAPADPNVQENLLARFAKPEYIRLLYDF